MTDLILPKAIAAYFDPSERSPEVFADCLTSDATVRDERRADSGHAAINRWRADTIAKYAFTSEPLTLKRKDDEQIVVARIARDFPGSPIDLTHRFRLDGGKIASLAIG